MKIVNRIQSKKSDNSKKSDHRELRTVAVYYGKLKGKFRNKKKNQKTTLNSCCKIYKEDKNIALL